MMIDEDNEDDDDGDDDDDDDDMVCYHSGECIDDIVCSVSEHVS